MGGPTFSEDGYWMWTGNDWIPAPPQSEVLDSSSLDTAAIQSAAARPNSENTVKMKIISIDFQFKSSSKKEVSPKY